MKFVIISGSVVSGIGKGVASSSIGVLLQHLGMSVTAIKIDPYLNVDASLLNPGEHGEVYVLGTCDSGAYQDSCEVDLDFGSYERFLNISLSSCHSITSGKIYQKVINSERKGDFLGQTVQVVPHITDAIQNWLLDVAKVKVSEEDCSTTPDVCIVELGGTVGDIESMPFVEALRQLQTHSDVEMVLNVHVSFLPIVNTEFKSKPIQNSVKMMRSTGLLPDILICRHSSDTPVEEKTIQKISRMCGIARQHVIPLATEKILWKVPLILDSLGVTDILSKTFDISKFPSKSTGLLQTWKSKLVDTIENATGSLTVVIVGKYNPYTEAYLSVIRALQHAALQKQQTIEIQYLDAGSETFQEQIDAVFSKSDAVVIPGGFGERGNENIIKACAWARAKRKPFLGICLGFQMAVTEYARNVLGMHDAVSAEFNDIGRPVVIHMSEFSKSISGASLRLGSHVTKLKQSDSMSAELYKSSQISERHRHRYEINPEYVDDLEKHGMTFVATDFSETRMEIMELIHERHPFYVGCQFHPEFQSRPLNPSPLFCGLIKAAVSARHHKNQK